MSKKIISAVLSLSILLCMAVAIVGCKDEGAELPPIAGAPDPYGREFDTICDIDEYPTGIYEISFAIEASAMGKSMLEKNCLDKLIIAISEDGCKLKFYCKNTSFTNIKIGDKEARAENIDSLYGYVFDIEREDLNGKIEMSGYVSVMKRDVEFVIVPDLTCAVLVG
ncbi:MAG: hypothetical protein K2I78_03140 [Clostridia bacterium]|nr:hypothetical protein [Clostridia bacterium]MDE7216366.1 hypothetical protein [Clostridia bacterium]